MLTGGETRRGSCRERRAVAMYRLDGRSSSRRWLGVRKAEIDWGNGVWGEAWCRFIGAWMSGGGRAAINWQLVGVSNLCFKDEWGREDSTRRLD
jgi:hypothetical protein